MAIQLDGVKQLQGTLPAETLAALNCSLTSLVLRGNLLLSGTLSDALSVLSRLRTLTLSGNRLEGTVPAALFDGLQMLEELDLSSNQLTGTIPPLMCGGAQRNSSLTRVALSFNQFTGALNFSNCESLRDLELQRNGLQGPIPDFVNCPRLQKLYVANNGLTGSIPNFFDNLKALQILDLSHNMLTGSIPHNMCGNTTRYSNLVDVTFAFNMLTGKLDISSCESLVLLGLENNALDGPVPDLKGCPRLHILRLAHNHMDGTISPDVSGASEMSTFVLSSNMLHGTIPPSLGTVALLIGVDLGDNSLTGPIPNEITKLGTLVGLILDRNRLTGTIPQDIGLIASLTYLALSSNDITGTIPDSLSRLVLREFTQYPVELNASLTKLSCCWDGVPAQPYSSFENSRRELLPEWLGFVPSVFVPVIRGLGSDLSDFPFLVCPQIGFVNKNSNMVQSLRWLLDPSYYRYQHCKCPPSYHLVINESGISGPGTGAVCVADPSFWVRNRDWLVAVIVVAAALLAVALLLSPNLCSSRALLVRAYINLRKRIEGIPQLGSVTVVITDIEGYSETMRRSPELMIRALNIHNAVLRNAKWSNFGNVIDQEGDSYAIVFREAVDAVAFCLQAQQSLVLQDWPKGLCHDPPPELTKRRSGSRILQNMNDFAASILGNRNRSNGNSNTGSQFETAGSGPSIDGRSNLAEPDFPYDGLFSAGAGTTRVTPTQPPSSDPLSPTSDKRYDKADTSDTVGDPPASATAAVATATAIISGRPLCNNGGSGGGLAPTGISQRGGGGPSGLRLRRSSTVMTPPVWCGLRVRMGLATGTLAVGTVSIRSSAIMEEAKMICDAGGGGQVLMDERTFLEIKDRLEELGAVDHNGINASKLNSMRPWWHLWRPVKRHSVDAAILLDMGEYRHCPTGELPTLPLETSHDQRLFSSLGMPGLLPRRQENEGASLPPRGGEDSPRVSVRRDAKVHLSAHSVIRTSMDMLRGLRRGHNPSSVRHDSGFHASFTLPEQHLRSLKLFQILSPRMSSRAKVFQNKLNLKPEWVMTDSPYFSAPGTLHAPLTEHDYHPEPLPAVTMVFASIDGGKQYALRHRKDAWTVHLITAAVIRATLRCVSGGYLCRLQDGELKYMVCFTTPQAACQWCLLVQQVLMFADWPESALKFDKFQTERAADGRLLFRGPRVKMGLCEGAPKTIIPDHLGRADYHGTSINQAARFMDAGAHGGQVVCEEALALQVFDTWRRELIPDLCVFATSTIDSSWRSRKGPWTPPGGLFSRSNTKESNPDVAAVAATVASAASAGGGGGDGRRRSDGGGGGGGSGGGGGRRGSDGGAVEPSQVEMTLSDHGGGAGGSRGGGGSSGGSSAGLQQYHPSTTQQEGLASILRTRSLRLGPALGSDVEGGEMASPVFHAMPSRSSLFGHPLQRGFTLTGSRSASQRMSEMGRVHLPRLSETGCIKFTTSPAPAHINEPDASANISDAGGTPGTSGNYGADFAPHIRWAQQEIRAATAEEAGEDDDDNEARPELVVSSRPGGPSAPGAAEDLSDSASTRRAVRLTPTNMAIHEASQSAAIDENITTCQMQPVEAHKMGAFRFKGSPDDVTMVYLVMGGLAARTFPSDPPKGKGNRISEDWGLLADGIAPMPNVESLFRERFDGVRTEASNTVDVPLSPTAAGSGPLPVFRSWSATPLSPSGGDSRPTADTALRARLALRIPGGSGSRRRQLPIVQYLGDPA